MNPNTFINMLFLCLVNVFFMVAGIFLNAVVIISLRRSSELRKKLCHFMIFVLTCFDLAVITISHPVIILSTIFWSKEVCSELLEQIRTHISGNLYVLSTTALLILNIERLLGLTFPLFHRTSVTKKRLLILQAFSTTLLSFLCTSALIINLKTLAYFLVIVYFSILLLLFIYFNYKMFTIAKSKFRDKEVDPTTATSREEGRKQRTLNFKTISTCSLAVACFFIRCCPQIIYSALRLTSEAPLNDRDVVLFRLWSNTFVSMNSTFNCLIFFWKNSILLREGMKIVKRLWTAIS